MSASLPAGADPPQHGGMPLALRTALSRAETLIKKGDHGRAVRTLKKFQTSRAAGADSYLVDFLMGNGRLGEGDPAAAAEHYESAVGKHPDFTEGWINLAQCRYALEKYEKAAGAFLKGYETDPSRDPDILYYAAVSYLAAEDPPAAAPLLERLLAEHGEYIRTEWREALAQAYLSAGQPERALPVMELLADQTTGEKQRRWQENLLHQYLALGMDRQVLDLAEHLTKIDPTEPKWWKALAHLNLSRDKYLAALAAFTVYGYLSPLNDSEKKLLADLHLMSGIPGKAAELYQALPADARTDALMERIIQTCWMAGRYEDALKWASIDPPDRQSNPLLALKGNMLYELKRYAEAVTIFEQLARKEGADQGRAWLMLGYAAWHLDDLDKAETAFQNAARHKPHQTESLSALDQISSIRKAGMTAAAPGRE